jgi:hypothetical protein
LLKVRRRHTPSIAAPIPEPSPQYRSSIEQYRPQVYH